MRRFLLGWITTSLALGFFTTLAQAEIPRKMAFQGRLTNAQGQPLNGNQTLTFRLFDAPAGGARLWEETQTLSVASGLFSTSLGSSTALGLPFDRPYWVEIQVGAEVLSPRQPLSSSPYALRAQALDGIYVVGSRVGIGTVDPKSNLHVVGSLGIGRPGDENRYALENTGGGETLQIGYKTPEGWFTSSPLMTLTYHGNVGIGTTDPGSYRLSVNGPAMPLGVGREVPSS